MKSYRFQRYDYDSPEGIRYRRSLLIRLCRIVERFQNNLRLVARGDWDDEGVYVNDTPQGHGDWLRVIDSAVCGNRHAKDKVDYATDVPSFCTAYYLLSMDMRL